MAFDPSYAGAIYRLDEHARPKRPSQTRNTTAVKCFLAGGFAVDGRHENDGQIPARCGQFPVQVDARYAAEMDVQQKAIRFARLEAVKKKLAT